MGERTSDTLAVLRGLGARALARAVARRALSTARALGRAAHTLAHPLAPADSSIYVTALRTAPSPLARVPDVAAAPALAAALPAMDPLETDPRLVWEEGRGARLRRLAAGSRASGSGALKQAFESALDDWLDRHAVDERTDPLEAGLRAWSLWVSLSMVGPGNVSEPLLARTARALVEHARLVLARLEDRGLVAGSHLVGELVGLYACGAALRGAGEEPAFWRRLARSGLGVAAAEQVAADGGGAEGSTGYSRFVAELWLAAIACARASGEEPPPTVVSAARRMLSWLGATMAPDGLDVGIGDDDDSRVLPGLAAPRDLLSLLPLQSLGEVAARLEGVPWSAEAGWLAGAEGRARWQAAPVVPWAPGHASPTFGLFLARRGGLGGDMVALRAGPHGQGGAGGHAHNDTLSLTMWLDGVPAIVDPGTGVYLGRPALRDRFRGVAAHATVTLDGLEPSPILSTRPFALPDRAGAHVVHYEDDGHVWRCTGEHHGYRRVGVTHRREVRYDRAARRVVVADTLLGVGSHRVTVGFPLASAEATCDGGPVVGAGPLRLIAADPESTGLAWRLEPGLWSHRYGSSAPSLVARRSGRVTLPVTLVTVITTG